MGLLADSKKSLWVGTPEQLTYFKLIEKEKIVYVNDSKNPNSISENFTTNIFEDSRKNIWVSTLSKGLNVYEGTSGKFYCFKNDPKNANSINNDAVNTVFEASNGVLWLGTNGGGLDALILQKGKNKFSQGYRVYHFTDKEGLPNNIINRVSS